MRDRQLQIGEWNNKGPAINRAFCCSRDAGADSQYFAAQRAAQIFGGCRKLLL
ncbi:MAG: hypothetical protein ACP5E2_03480 [Terracidiphilus sp.]